MSRGRIAVLVSNDLSFDQRVRKTCATLQKAGYEPVLIGRRMVKTDAPSIDRPYPTQRIWLRASQGPMFYLLLQQGLLKALNEVHANGGLVAIWANDLDTLGPAVFGGRKWKLDVAYDSHEWFTEAEGLKNKPVRKGIWTWWQKRMFRHLRRMLTVNESIAKAYRAEGLEVDVVPNVPELSPPVVPMSRADLGWPGQKTVLLIQGAFMDRDRGALDAVRSLVHLPDIHLALIGAGPEFDEAPELASALGVRDRLHVHERMPFHELCRCTVAADVGLSLDRSTVDNFKFSLPNKLFDYLHAGLPVVCSDLPVAGRFVTEEGVGQVVETAKGDDGVALATSKAVLALLNNKPSSEHLSEVASRYHWGSHEATLLQAIHPLR